MRPSELRYLYYLVDIIDNPPILPHYKPVTLVSIQLQPVPLFTKIRDGCRPYLEVYNECRCVLSTLQDYERMRLFNIAEGKCLLPINTTVCGDVCVIVYHARNVLGGVMSAGKATGIKIAQIQFHTGYIPEEETMLRYSKADLDELHEGHDHYQERFNVCLNVFVSDMEKKPSQPAPWCTDKTERTLDTMFTTQLEKDETVDNFVSKPAKKKPPNRPIPPPSPRVTHVVAETKADSSDSDTEQFINDEKCEQLEEAVDLLNLNSMPQQRNVAAKQSPSSNVDLLSGLVDENSTNSENMNAFSNAETKREDVFDPFGNSNGESDGNAGFMGGWGDFTAAPPKPEPEVNKTDDFFSNLGIFTIVSSVRSSFQDGFFCYR